MVIIMSVAVILLDIFLNLCYNNCINIIIESNIYIYIILKGDIYEKNK